MSQNSLNGRSFSKMSLCTLKKVPIKLKMDAEVEFVGSAENLVTCKMVTFKKFLKIL